MDTDKPNRLALYMRASRGAKITKQRWRVEKRQGRQWVLLAFAPTDAKAHVLMHAFGGECRVVAV